MSDVIEFDCSLPPRGLRVNSATPVRGWRAKLKAEYQEQVWCAGNQAMAAGPRGNAWVFNYGLERVTGSRDPNLLFDPAVNMAVAEIIWLDQGWGPWSCRP